MRAFRLLTAVLVVWAVSRGALAAEPRDLVVIPQSAQQTLELEPEGATVVTLPQRAGRRSA